MDYRQTAYDSARGRLVDQEERIVRQLRLISDVKAKGLSTVRTQEILDLLRTTRSTLQASLHHFPS